MTFSAYLPITATVAIGLFVLKELVEAIRKWRGNARRLQGLKHQLAVECELNEWFIHSLGKILDRIVQAEAKNEEKPAIFFELSGETVIRFDVNSRATGIRGFNIPTVTCKHMEQGLLEVATLSRRLFQVLQPAIDASHELENVRNGLIKYVMPLEADVDVNKGAYFGYARSELNKAHASLESLYKLCTGEPLERQRIR